MCVAFPNAPSQQMSRKPGLRGLLQLAGEVVSFSWFLLRFLFAGVISTLTSKFRS
jgi:hypothetical protein